MTEQLRFQGHEQPEAKDVEEFHNHDPFEIEECLEILAYHSYLEESSRLRDTLRPGRWCQWKQRVRHENGEWIKETVVRWRPWPDEVWEPVVFGDYFEHDGEVWEAISDPWDAGEKGVVVTAWPVRVEGEGLVPNGDAMPVRVRKLQQKSVWHSDDHDPNAVLKRAIRLAKIARKTVHEQAEGVE